MGYLTRMCPYCGFKVSAIADTEEEANDFARKLWEDNTRHKAACWFERLPQEQQLEIATKEAIKDYELAKAEGLLEEEDIDA